MPLYDFKCSECNREAKDVLCSWECAVEGIPCDNCPHTMMDMQMPMTARPQVKGGTKIFHPHRSKESA